MVLLANNKPPRNRGTAAFPLLCFSHVKDTTPLYHFKWWLVNRALMHSLSLKRAQTRIYTHLQNMDTHIHTFSHTAVCLYLCSLVTKVAALLTSIVHEGTSDAEQGDAKKADGPAPASDHQGVQLCAAARRELSRRDRSLCGLMRSYPCVRA